MIRQDYHMHTTYCDGKNTVEEMVLAAIDRGLDVMGFSGHSYTAFDTSYCMSKEQTLLYQKDVATAKKAYGDRIRILCGIEQDVFSDADTSAYDYVIASTHYVNKDGQYLPIDLSKEQQRLDVERFFGGDYYAFAEAYYETVAAAKGYKTCDIIGHFDLVCKFNEGCDLFDETHPRYVTAWQTAADELLKLCKPFEINTGAISKGYRTLPYPMPPILSYLKEHGARFVLSSDSHRCETLLFDFEKYASYVDNDHPWI